MRSRAERYVLAIADQKTVIELRKAAEITDNEINAAVDVVLAQPETKFYPIGGSCLLDLAAAIEAHEPTHKVLANAKASRADGGPWCGPRS